MSNKISRQQDKLTRKITHGVSGDWLINGCCVATKQPSWVKSLRIKPAIVFCTFLEISQWVRPRIEPLERVTCWVALITHCKALKTMYALAELAEISLSLPFWNGSL